MGRQKQERSIAMEAAEGLCDGAIGRAAEVGLYAGRVKVDLENRQVRRAHFHPSEVRCPHGAQPRLSGRCGCPSYHDVEALFTETLRPKLADTILCFGNVVFVFAKGRLRRIDVTETFRIEREIPDLARIFLAHWRQIPTTRDALRGFAQRESKATHTARAREK